MSRTTKAQLRPLARLAAAVSLTCAALAAPVVNHPAAKGATPMALRQEGRVRAPELEGGRGWLNTGAPLSLAHLRGKVVLLDFWTYGCINCLHVIPDLQRLEEKYARQLVVIGVHSAKFDNEKETENIRRVILRYGIEHPVVNDADFRIWRSYAVRAWPTQVLIDPAGYVVGQVAGEGHYEALDEAIGRLVEEFRRRGGLNEQPLKLALERAKVGDLPLAFPGKVLADAKGDRLFIADSNHHRVVVTRLDGKVLDIIGTGERGARDGPLDRATFYRPQGLALAGDTLYVADTSNHLIRRVDLKARTVETVAGTGEQSRDYRVRGGAARATPLSSPWDLLLDGHMLYVAMAGPHQIWRLDLRRGQLSVFAGTGREARLDGPRSEAAFAQPSGLASDGRTLYVADSESNIIRAIDLKGFARGAAPPAGDASRGPAEPASLASEPETAEEVRTLAGGDLFEFGDRDGRGDGVRLQHPLGLAFHEGRLYVADTYNHKIKLLDPRARTVRTFAGTGRPGQADGPAPSFYEPGGLSVARGRLYVADTNNHAVRVVDLKTGMAATLKLDGLRPPELSAAADVDEDSSGPEAEEIKLAPQPLAAGAGGALVVHVRLPEGHHLNPSAPQRYKITVEAGRERLKLARPEAQGPRPPGDLFETARASKELSLPLRVPLEATAPGTAALRARLTLFYCREDNTGTCRIKTLTWHAPVEVTDAPGAPREIRLEAEVE
ncbi:MAG TPA: thioredoxin-like domain-containing protein [Pyrinomonadaceae bacterium]|nr:thioredoxin-like domain-containing protein [Pyrinomonadaceae bacterium]